MYFVISFIYIHIRVCRAGKVLDCSVKWTLLGDVSLLHPFVFLSQFSPLCGSSCGPPGHELLSLLSSFLMATAQQFVCVFVGLLAHMEAA